MKALITAFLSILPCVSISLTYAAESSFHEVDEDCKKLYQAWVYNNLLEDACSFNGGLSAEIGKDAKIVCEGVLPESNRDLLSKEVFEVVTSEIENIGEKAFCKANELGYYELGVDTQPQADELAAFSAPLDLHMEELMIYVDIEPRYDCRIVHQFRVVGCIVKTGKVGFVQIGEMSPCRMNGTLQLDFDYDLYLVGLVCGSSKELLASFITIMNDAFGAGRETYDPEGRYKIHIWNLSSMRVTAKENEGIYSVAVSSL